VVLRRSSLPLFAQDHFVSNSSFMTDSQREPPATISGVADRADGLYTVGRAFDESTHAKIVGVNLLRLGGKGVPAHA